MTTTKKRLTLEEFLQLPEAEPAFEFEEGAAKQKVAPKRRHSWLQFQLTQRINNVAAPAKLGAAFPELRTTFGGRSYVPDISYFRWQRIPRSADDRFTDEEAGAPDVAIEILSPGQSASALLHRCLWYVENDVQVALLVAPADETVLVFRLNQIPKGLRDQDLIDLEELLPGLRLTVRELFDSLTGD